MKATLLLFFVLIITGTAAQTIITETFFIGQTITYNGSDNPNECIEAVDQGLVIESGKYTGFYLLPAADYDSLKQQLENQKVVVELVLFDEPNEGSGAKGSVVKITHNGVVVFQRLP